MRRIARLVISFLLFCLMQANCFAADTASPHFDETAARTGDVMVFLSYVALAAIAAFIIFIIASKSKNKDSRD